MDTTHQHKLLQLLLSALVPNFRRTAAAKLEEERLVETMSALDEGKF